jgi:D-inositol-3-phosphate glycosyltransferase
VKIIELLFSSFSPTQSSSIQPTILAKLLNRVPSGNSRYLFTFTSLKKAIQLAKEADVVHTTTYNAVFPAWLAAKLRRKPCILTVHETWIGNWKEFTNLSTPSAFLHDLAERVLYIFPFTAYSCVSQSTAKELQKHFPKRKIHAISNGFDPAQWKKKVNTSSLRKKLNLQNNFVVYGYGRPGTSKGFEYLVEAFHEVENNIPSAKLVLILSNDKQYAKNLEHLKNIASKNTVFLPSQPYKDLPKFSQMADCIVVPSLNEGFGYVVLESVASQTPVIATNAGSIPEVIGGKHILVKPRSASTIANGIHDVYNKKWATTKNKAFTWKNNVHQHEKLYREVRK